MTKFQFTLGRVLDFRRLRADLAKAALDRLHAERQDLFNQEQALVRMRAAEEGAIRAPGTSLTVTNLDALDHLQSYVALARKRFARQHLELAARIAKQQTEVIDADRQVGLLEKLEARQRAEWKTNFNKELDELAADSYLSRYHRQSKLGDS